MAIIPTLKANKSGSVIIIPLDSFGSFDYPVARAPVEELVTFFPFNALALSKERIPLIRLSPNGPKLAY